MTPAERPPLWATLLACVVLNTAVALTLWLLVPAMGRFGSTFIYSQCVGLSITLVSVAIARIGAPLGLWRLPGPLGLLAMLVPAAPIGYVIGHLIASGLTGKPIRLLGGGPIVVGALLATVLATALAGYMLWARQRLAREARAREEAQRLAAEAELRLLRAQLEPHMLFNTLANLRELMVEEPAAAQQMLDELIAWLRAALAATRSERTTLEQEFAQQQAYLKLMARRMGPRLQWQAQLPEDLRSASVPPMLLQPLVENAIRHGLEPQPGPGSITLSAERDADTLRLTVADTGRGLRPGGGAAPVGHDPAGSAGGAGGVGGAGGGYGLSHVRERLRALYGDAASLTLAPMQPRGVCAVVRIPAS